MEDSWSPFKKWEADIEAAEPVGILVVDGTMEQSPLTALPTKNVNLIPLTGGE